MSEIEQWIEKLALVIQDLDGSPPRLSDIADAIARHSAPALRRARSETLKEAKFMIDEAPTWGAAIKWMNRRIAELEQPATPEKKP